MDTLDSIVCEMARHELEYIENAACEHGVLDHFQENKIRFWQECLNRAHAWALRILETAS